MNKIDLRTNSVTASYYNSCPYYPFGSVMSWQGTSGAVQGRSFSFTQYRYGFNGENVDQDFELEDYGFRYYSSRLGRFISTDPLSDYYEFYSPFHFAGNCPIMAKDIDGLEPDASTNSSGSGTTLSAPVILMFKYLYGPSFTYPCIYAKIAINQKIHDNLTKYTSGAITLGFTINYTEDYKNSSDRKFLSLTAHEIVHVRQFISMFGKTFETVEDYNKAVASWIAVYGILAIDAMKKSTDKDKIHEAHVLEIEATKYEKIFGAFLISMDYSVTSEGKTIKKNYLLELLAQMDEATKNKNTVLFNSLQHQMQNMTTFFNSQDKKESTGDGVYIHASSTPNRNTSRGMLYKGDKIVLTGNKSNGYSEIITKTGIKGWVSDKYIKQ